MDMDITIRVNGNARFARPMYGYRKVAPKISWEVVDTCPAGSSCCGHALVRGGPPCTCKDVDCQVVFTLHPVVLGGKVTQQITVEGEITLNSDGKFSISESWSWEEGFLRRVKALIGRDRIPELERDIEIQCLAQ